LVAIPFLTDSSPEPPNAAIFSIGERPVYKSLHAVVADPFLDPRLKKEFFPFDTFPPPAQNTLGVHPPTHNLMNCASYGHSRLLVPRVYQCKILLRLETLVTGAVALFLPCNGGGCFPLPRGVGVEPFLWCRRSLEQPVVSFFWI